MRHNTEELDRCSEILRSRLYLLLERTDLTVRDFSRRAGVNAQTLYSFFYGKTKLPSIGVLYCISKTYKVPIDWMLGYPCRPRDEERLIGGNYGNF